MNTFLLVAEEMYDSGKLSVKDYKSVVSYVEQTYYNPDSFWPTVARWVDDLILSEGIIGQKEVLHRLLETYLYAEAADNHEERERILRFARRIKELFANLEKYHPEDIQAELQKHLKFG